MSKQEVTQEIIRQARAKGLLDKDINILLAIAYIESRFNPDAKNPKSNAKGVFQYIHNPDNPKYDTWGNTGRLGYRSDPNASPFDPYANIETMINQYIKEIKPKIDKITDEREAFIRAYKYHHDGGFNKPDTPEYLNTINRYAANDAKYNFLKHEIEKILSGKETNIENTNLNNIAPNNPYYIVQPGHTLSKIAKRYGVDLNDLINENRR